ncbi:hypothetical protein H4F99_14255 [Lysobacter sp. SG-8]|uniref:DUF2798 domain-containing protein n=1 Tax=Marilutibacter penaei TaxID=2759900 RepID=A0A7W3U639_9GAMM|nr:hypothetical protein [Lysobacter penaei]MBB1089644.1 hypothetical protein [Lysobacter penaei]
MLSPRLLQRVYFPMMLSALSVLAVIAVMVVREGLVAGRVEAWMALWVLASVLGLPLLMLVAPALDGLRRLARSRDNVPDAGGSIP